MVASNPNNECEMNTTSFHGQEHDISVTNTNPHEFSSPSLTLKNWK